MDDEEPIVVEREIAQIEEGGDASEVKLFGRWKFDDIEVKDISLVVSIIVHFQA